MTILENCKNMITVFQVSVHCSLTEEFISYKYSSSRFDFLDFMVSVNWSRVSKSSVGENVELLVF